MGVAYSVGHVDHLHTFFVEWSPDGYGKEATEQSFIVVDDDQFSMMDSLFRNPPYKNWEIITIHEAKWQESTCNSEEEEPEDLTPELIGHSDLLDEIHLQKLAKYLPVRTQGYPWKMAYSTAVHGISLKTLYRNLTPLDGCALLIIRDMNNQVFGAFSSHPFRVSDRCYGNGETFLYSFTPDLKVFRWTGENSYFVRGHSDYLQIGAGGGHFGLWLDSDLHRGSSFPCKTFHNQPLSSQQDFKVKDLEVWILQSGEN